MENFAKETKRDEKNIQTIYDYICIIFYVYLYDGNAYNYHARMRIMKWQMDEFMYNWIYECFSLTHGYVGLGVWFSNSFLY